MGGIESGRMRDILKDAESGKERETDSNRDEDIQSDDIQPSTIIVCV